MTPVSNDVLIWIFNYILISVFLYKSGYRWVAAMFIGVNSYITSTIMDAAIVLPIVLIGTMVTTYYSMIELRKLVRRSD